MPEQNSEFTTTIPDPLKNKETTMETIASASHASARCKEETVTALPPQEQPGSELKPIKYLYYVLLGSSITHEMPPK